jgi:hypothetical protein
MLVKFISKQQSYCADWSDDPDYGGKLDCCFAMKFGCCMNSRDWDSADSPKDSNKPSLVSLLGVTKGAVDN